jgi:hypothetical protein
MPAAAILVHPADAVDRELLNLDFFQNAGLFTAYFVYQFLLFHVFLLLNVYLPHHTLMRPLLLYNATLMPNNKTVI